MAEEIQFPSYPPPKPGIPAAERKQSDPLWKLTKFMMKPKHRSLEKTPFSKKQNKKKQKYY